MTTCTPKPLGNKYDLMHYNTPSYASTVITWDCSKMGKVTKNRVLEWLSTGKPKYSRGEAASMYHQLRRSFEIPTYQVDNATLRKDGKGYSGGYIRWEHATPQLMHVINQVYKAERVIRRMENASGNGWMPWYMEKESQDNPTRGYFYIDNPHDLTEVNAEIDKIMNSPDISKRKEEAIALVESGGQLTFTWR